MSTKLEKLIMQNIFLFKKGRSTVQCHKLILI